MRTITFKEYKSIPNKDGLVFFFAMPGFCGVCELYEREVSKYNIPELVKVTATAEQEDDLMNLEIVALPCTRIYNGEKVVYEKYGVLYEHQIQELIAEIGKWKVT